MRTEHGPQGATQQRALAIRAPQKRLVLSTRPAGSLCHTGLLVVYSVFIINGWLTSALQQARVLGPTFGACIAPFGPTDRTCMLPLAGCHWRYEHVMRMGCAPRTWGEVG
jgi:hypothetical protein